MEGVALRGLDIVLERLDDIIQQDLMDNNSLKLDLSTKKKLKVAQTARKSAKYCPTVLGPSPDTTPPIQHLEPTKSNGTSPVMAKETSIKRFAKQNGISVKVEKPQPKESNGTPKTKMLQNGANIPPKAIKLQSGAYILPKSIMLQRFANGPPKPTMLQMGTNEETSTHQLNHIQTSNTPSTFHSMLSPNSTPKTTSKASTPTTLTSTNLMLTKPTTNSMSKTDLTPKSGLTLTNISTSTTELKSTNLTSKLDLKSKTESTATAVSTADLTVTTESTAITKSTKTSTESTAITKSTKTSTESTATTESTKTSTELTATTKSTKTPSTETTPKAQSTPKAKTTPKTISTPTIESTPTKESLTIESTPKTESTTEFTPTIKSTETTDSTTKTESTPKTSIGDSTTNSTTSTNDLPQNSAIPQTPKTAETPQTPTPVVKSETSDSTYKTEVKRKKPGIESVVRTLNTKAIQQNKELGAKAVLKRPASPSYDETSSKRRKSEESQTDERWVDINHGDHIKTKKCNCSLDAMVKIELKKYVKQFVKREMALQESLRLKNEECVRMKAKCESTEKTFRSWIEFANKLQARVKKIVFTLHRHQDSLKLLQNRDSPKCNAETQTSTRRTTTRQTQTETPAQPAFIDLTDEEGNKSSRKPKHNVAKQPPPANHNTTKPTHPTQRQIATPKNAEEKLKQIFAQASDAPPRHTKLFNGGPRAPVIQHSNLGSNSLLVYGDGKMTYQQSTSNPPLKMQANKQPNAKHPLTTLPTQAQSLFMRRNHNINQTIVHSPYPPLPTTPQPTGFIPQIAPAPPQQLVLTIKKNKGVIVLSWHNGPQQGVHAEVESYELFAYQSNSPMVNKSWKRVGNDSIAAMPLPMACTLTQFSHNFTYYFAVRGRDIYGRFGPFSTPCCSSDPT